MQSILRHYSEDEIVTVRAGQDGIERFEVRNPNYKLKKHSTLLEYCRALGDERFRNLYKFACVRNPWERMLSRYFSPGRRAMEWDREAFKQLILKTLPAADYLRLAAGEGDPFANVDRMIRFENLSDDFQSVCLHLDIPPAPLPAYNRSEREHYAKYYDEELRELVAAHSAAEIERFGYTFD